MGFPPHIEAVLAQFGVAADTKAALYEAYVSLGPAVLEAFADHVDVAGAPERVRPEDLVAMRRAAITGYLRASHPTWLRGEPTGSLWRPRAAEGRASGLTTPLGFLDENEEGSPFASRVARASRDVVGEAEALPAGILVLARNAHLSGDVDTVTFDVVAATLDDALALSEALGPQNTTPGSVGQVTVVFDAVEGVALVRELGSNLEGERTEGIAAIYARERNWEIVTLVASVLWLAETGATMFVPQDAPWSGVLARCCEALGWELGEADDASRRKLRASTAQTDRPVVMLRPATN